MATFPKVHEANEKGVKHTTHVQHFDSPQQFVDQAHRLFTKTASKEMIDRLGPPDQYDGGSYYNYPSDFNGNMTGREQHDAIFARSCNGEVRSAIHASALELAAMQSTQLPVEQMDMYHDETGLFLDANAYYNGDEFNMISMETQQQTRPVVYLAASFSAGSRWEQVQFTNRGIAIIKCVHALERMGVSVGVIAYGVSLVSDTVKARSNHKPQRIVSTIIVKAPEQALDESDLINSLTNATLLRTAGFQNMYYQLGGNSSDLGRPQTLTREDLKHSGMGDVEIATMPYSNKDQHHYDTIDGALGLLIKAVNKQTSIAI